MIFLLGIRTADTHMKLNVKLPPDQRKILDDTDRYRRLVDKLNYLTVTRPDIAFVVNVVSVVSQFLLAPRTTH